MDADRLKTTMTISKAIALMTDKYSCEMVQRHVRALNRIANNYKQGYMLKDLSSLGQLLKVCVERVQRYSEYEEPICRIIHVCSKPFLKEKTSDETKYAASVIETFLMLGKMMSKCPVSVCCEIASAVASFYSADHSKEENLTLPEELKGTRRTYNAVLIERSSVAKYIAESLQRYSDSRNACLPILNAILTLSTNATNCNHMLLVGVASSVCSCLSLSGAKAMFIGVEVIWNLLQYGSQLQVAEQLSTFKCIRMLQKLFKSLMMTATSQQDKQLRNDMLMITSLIAALCPGAPFVETGFLIELCQFATFSEDDRLPSESTRHLKLTQDHEDFELKKSLMSLLITLSNDSPAAVQVLSQQKIPRAFFSYVTANDKVSSEWTLAQFEELQLLALSCLSILSPQCIEDYMICQGSTRILLLIEWCNKMEGNFTGFGNSFHGQGGHGTRVSQLRYSLRLLLSMSNTGDEALLQDLHEQGAIPVLIGLLKQFLDQTAMEDNSVHLEMQADCLLILSCLCELNGHRKELFGGYDGIQALIQCLKKDPQKFSSGLGHHRLLLAATDCTWCAVVGNNMVEDIFLENEGVFVLLDLLLVSPKNMRSLVLGVLVDLCDNPKAIPHVTAWRGKSQSNAWSLLVELWRQEERDLEVPRDVMNTVAGTTLPLVGAEQSRQGMSPLPTNQPSPAILDVTENMRAKIYALCTKLGFQCPSNSLTTEDKITMCIIQSYLDFKTGEVWYELASELAQEGLRPITPDQEGMQEILQCAEEKTEEVIKQQHELIDEQHRKDLDEEYLFYEQLRDSQLIKERTEEKYEKHTQRTSNYKTLKEAKQHQQTVIDNSRPSAVNLGERFHVVEQSNLNVTVFCGRHVSVNTTPMKLLPNDSSHVPPPTTTAAAAAATN